MSLLVVVCHVVLQCTYMLAFRTGVFFFSLFYSFPRCPLRSSLALRLPKKTTNRLFYRLIVYPILMQNVVVVCLALNI